MLQGRDSSISDKGTSAYLTRFMEAELKGPSVQIRVEQGLYFCCKIDSFFLFFFLIFIVCYCCRRQRTNGFSCFI